MLLIYLLLAAPIIAAALWWGSWTWVAVALVVAVVEFGALRRSERFSARLRRTIGMRRRRNRERVIESAYVIAASCGVLLAVGALANRGL